MGEPGAVKRSSFEYFLSICLYLAPLPLTVLATSGVQKPHHLQQSFCPQPQKAPSTSPSLTRKGLTDALHVTSPGLQGQGQNHSDFGAHASQSERTPLTQFNACSDFVTPGCPPVAWGYLEGTWAILGEGGREGRQGREGGREEKKGKTIKLLFSPEV